MIMGIILNKYVDNPNKRAVLGWIKTFAVIFIFIIVAQYFISESTYQQGFNDCKKQVATSLGQSYVDSIFPNITGNPALTETSISHSENPSPSG